MCKIPHLHIPVLIISDRNIFESYYREICVCSHPPHMTYLEMNQESLFAAGQSGHFD